MKAIHIKVAGCLKPDQRTGLDLNLIELKVAQTTDCNLPGTFKAGILQEDILAGGEDQVTHHGLDTGIRPDLNGAPTNCENTGSSSRAGIEYDLPTEDQGFTCSKQKGGFVPEKGGQVIGLSPEGKGGTTHHCGVAPPVNLIEQEGVIKGGDFNEEGVGKGLGSLKGLEGGQVLPKVIVLRDLIPDLGNPNPVIGPYPIA